MNDEIRAILKQHGRLAVDPLVIADEADLYKVGLTSHASVNVMLALEGAFGVEFPERMLRRDVFGTILAIRSAIEELRSEQ